jgi:acyl carrier protein
MTIDDRKRLVRSFIVDNLLFGDGDGLDDDTAFFAAGIVDSTGFLELVLFLEETFDIRLEDDEVVPENLDSLNLIGRFLEKKLAKGERPAELSS